MANGRFITTHTFNLKFTEAVQGGRESNKVMEGTLAAEVLRADDAYSTARVGKSRAEPSGRLKGRAVRVGLEDDDGGFEATGVAQNARSDGGTVREDGCVFEPSISPSEDFVNGASDAVGLGVKGRLLLQAVGGSVAVADILLPHWSGGVAVRAVVAARLPGLGD